MTRMTRLDCAVMCNLINTHTHTNARRRKRQIDKETESRLVTDRLPVVSREAGIGGLMYSTI